VAARLITADPASWSVLRLVMCIPTNSWTSAKEWHVRGTLEEAAARAEYHVLTRLDCGANVTTRMKGG
jgi:hypothetical protein